MLNTDEIKQIIDSGDLEKMRSLIQSGMIEALSDGEDKDVKVELISAYLDLYNEAVLAETKQLNDIIEIANELNEKEKQIKEKDNLETIRKGLE